MLYYVCPLLNFSGKLIFPFYMVLRTSPRQINLYLILSFYIIINGFILNKVIARTKVVYQQSRTHMVFYFRTV